MTASLGQVGRTIAGGVLIVTGIVLLVLPGPGLLLILAGLALLARDYKWAARWLRKARDLPTRGRALVRRSPDAETQRATCDAVDLADRKDRAA